MGGVFLMRDLLRQQLTYAEQTGFADQFRPYLAAVGLHFQLNKLDIQIGGASFADVVDANSRHDGSAAQFRFMVESRLVRYAKSHKAVLQANQRDPFVKYPNCTLQNIDIKPWVYEDIDPLIIEAAGLAHPQDAAVVFDQNRPQRFTVTLYWENDLGESTSVHLDFDTKRNIFDWNFLKLPSESGMEAMSNAALRATKAILESIQATVLSKYQEKVQERNISSSEGANGRKREHVTDEVYALRKQVRKEAREKTASVRVDLVESIDTAGIPKTILSPEPADFQRMLGNIDPAARGIVLKAIDRFNKEGVGEFTRKRVRGKDGVALYTLRVGDTRVLVYEADSKEGIRQFKIIDIDDRSRIYRMKNIKV